MTWRDIARPLTMKIGIIGAGHIGATLARHFAKAGHEVGISNSRGPHTLAGLVKSMGPKTCAMTSHEAAWFGEVVILAAPWRKTEALPLPKLVEGKIVVDAMNPYSAEGEVIPSGESTSSEEVARHLPGARVVKAFNTMYYHTLATETRDSAINRLVIFLAGDDAAAKKTVARLVEQIGFAPLDTGPLHTGGRMQEPDSPLYNRPFTLEEARAALRSLEAAVAQQ